MISAVSAMEVKWGHVNHLGGTLKTKIAKGVRKLCVDYKIFVSVYIHTRIMLGEPENVALKYHI